MVEFFKWRAKTYKEYQKPIPDPYEFVWKPDTDGLLAEVGLQWHMTSYYQRLRRSKGLPIRKRINWQWKFYMNKHFGIDIFGR